MKNSYALVLALALPHAPALAQAYGELDLNDIRARFYSHGLIGFDLSTGTSAFEAPKNQGTHPLLSAGLWVGGRDASNVTFLAAMQRESVGDGDYYPGPLTIDGSASTNATVMAQYDHVYIVTREQLILHNAYYHCLADPNCDVNVEFPDGYTIPPSFFDWPAINVTPGYEPYLAPFLDFNGDGDYIPTDGDMPCIMGDQTAFYVFNDKGGLHMLSGTQPIGLEVRAMPFEFNSAGPALDQTVFVHYQLINRGTHTLNDTYIGLYMDPDLGCSEDDYIGSDPARNLIYAYNATNNDADCMGTQGYGEQPPAFGMVLLRGPLMAPDGTDNASGNTLPAWNGHGFDDGVVDNERLGISHAMYFMRDGSSAMTDPTLPAHFMNYLRSYWKDGAPLTYDGTGYGGSVPARFTFPDDTDPLGVGTNGQIQPAWSEASEGNAPGDRRALGSMGPITLEPGMHMNITLAFVYARAGSGGPSASVQALQERVDSVNHFFYNNPYWPPFMLDQGDETMLCMGNYALPVEEHHSMSMRLYPNPTSSSFTVQAMQRMNGHLLFVHDATGRVVLRQRLVQGTNTLEVGALAPGIYSCEVLTEQERYTGRLVKE